MAECDVEFQTVGRRTQRYCCLLHERRDAKRRARALRRAQGQPYVVGLMLCEVDGRAFTVDIISRGGRPKKYDCRRCCEIAAILRSMQKESR